MNNSQIKGLALKLAAIREGEQISASILYDVALILEEKRASRDLIFKLLEKRGINRLFEILYSSDKLVRKLGAKLICYLSHKSEKIQSVITELQQDSETAFTAIEGIVTINKMPPSLILELKSKHGVQLFNSMNQDVSAALQRDGTPVYWSFPKYYPP